MHEEKLTFLKIFVTLGLLISLPLVFILTNSPAQKQDVRSRAASSTPVPGKIIFVPYSYSQDEDDDDIFEFKEKPQIRNGFVPDVLHASTPQYLARLISKQNATIANLQFSNPNIVTLDRLDTQQNKTGGEMKEVAANSRGIILPYHPDAKYVQIINPQGIIVKTISLANLSETNNIIETKEIRGDEVKDNRQSLLDKYLPNIKKVLAANGALNITIIGDNYNGDNLHFQNDVSDIASGLLSIEPFKTNKSNIIFYPQLSAVSLCSYNNPALSCNDTLSLKEASSTPYDKIYVLYNGPYAGFAYVGSTLSYGTNAAGMSTPVKQALFIHEMAGHALGGLMDEYSYNTTGASYAPNCSEFSSCPSWNTISGLGCFSSCGYTNLFRATDNGSVMNTALLNGVLNFDAFSTQIVNGKLVTFLGSSQPTATLPPPMPTPTISPSLTPSISPTLTLIPLSLTPTPSVLPSITPIDFIPSITPDISPTPSPTPTFTLTPTSTLTPTPSQIPLCTFPNYCTPAKYCDRENILPVSCNSENNICCKVNDLNTPTPAIPNQPSPTPVQRFEALPTQIVSPSIKPSVSISITPISTSFTTPTNIPTITKPITGNIDNSENWQETPQTTNPPKPTTEITIPQNTPTLVIFPTPTDFIYPSATPIEVEKIIFDRPSPSPRPRVRIFDALSAPSRFINDLVRNFFSIFTRKQP